MDQLLVMPLSTFETHFGLPNGYYTIEVRPKSRALLEAAKAEVTQIMRRSHSIGRRTPTTTSTSSAPTT